MATEERASALRKTGRVVLPGLLLFAGTLFAVGFSHLPAYGQSADDMRPVYDRLDRLERDLNLLQRQVYRGAVEGGEAVMPPTQQTSGGTGSNAALEVRLGQVDDQIRALTGKIEESNHRVDQLKDRLDKLVADVDNRLATLERSADANRSPAAGTPTQAPGAQAAAAGGGAQGAGTQGAGTAGATGVPETGPMDAQATAATEGTLPNPPSGAAGSAQTAQAVTAPGPGPLPSGTPLEQYQQARAYLTQANYGAAEASLKNFLKSYPNNELAENAYYWLGETYYVRSDYKNAAITFADGYQKFPAGAKAPDNLLKLGMSLANLGQTDQACKTFVEIDRKFPQADANVRERAANERKQRGCK